MPSDQAVVTAQGESLKIGVGPSSAAMAMVCWTVLTTGYVGTYACSGTAILNLVYYLIQLCSINRSMGVVLFSNVCPTVYSKKEDRGMGTAVSVSHDVKLERWLEETKVTEGTERIEEKFELLKKQSVELLIMCKRVHANASQYQTSHLSCIDGEYVQQCIDIQKICDDVRTTIAIQSAVRQKGYGRVRALSGAATVYVKMQEDRNKVASTIDSFIRLYNYLEEHAQEQMYFVPVLDFFRLDSSLWISMVAMDGDGYKFVRSFDSTTIQQCLQGVLSCWTTIYAALRGLHKRGLFFHDIKPANVGYRVLDKQPYFQFIDVECINSEPGECSQVDYFDPYNWSANAYTDDKDLYKAIELWRVGISCLEMVKLCLEPTTREPTKQVSNTPVTNALQKNKLQNLNQMNIIFHLLDKKNETTLTAVQNACKEEVAETIGRLQSRANEPKFSNSLKPLIDLITGLTHSNYHDRLRFQLNRK